MQNQLHLHLLGTPQIRVGDSPLHEFPAPKVKLLFFYLVLFRHIVHSRAALAGLFWGESGEAQARHSLNTTIWRLRQWLETLRIHPAGLLLVENEQIEFNASGPLWLDTAEFEQHITRARQLSGSAPEHSADAMTRAIELYRGDLLDGYYTDWCVAERARLQQLFMQALVYLMVYHGGRREYAQAITFAQRLLRDEPLREDVQRELMKLFVLDNQPAEALLQYRRCETALRDELGIQPMPETQQVFRQLLLKTAASPLGDKLAALGPLLELPTDVPPLSTTITAALAYFEAARQELDKGIAALHALNAT